MAKPIRPDEVHTLKEEHFPEEVFQSFNELIAETFCGNSTTITQKKVVDRMIEKGLRRDDIFDKGWLHIESSYSAAGWKVTYDRPAFNETYGAKFIFQKKEP